MESSDDYVWLEAIPNSHLCAIFDALDFLTIRIEPQPTIEHKIMMQIKHRLQSDRAHEMWFKTYRNDLVDRLKNWAFEISHPLTKRTVEK